MLVACTFKVKIVPQCNQSMFIIYKDIRTNIYNFIRNLPKENIETIVIFKI